MFLTINQLEMFKKMFTWIEHYTMILCIHVGPAKNANMCALVSNKIDTRAW